MALCCFSSSPDLDSWLPRNQREIARETDADCWAWGEGKALGWLGRLVVETHLVLVLSDPPVEMEGRGGTLEVD